RSARVELDWRAAVGALLRSGFVLVACCVFAGLRLIVRRRLTEPLSLGDDHTLPHHEVRCAPQQNSLSIGSYGSHSVIRRCRLNVRFGRKRTRVGEFRGRRYRGGTEGFLSTVVTVAPNFRLPENSPAEVPRVNAAMVQARDAVEHRTWSHPEE